MLETGITDFNKLTAISLKSQILKGPPKRSYTEIQSYTEITKGLMNKASIMAKLEIRFYTKLDSVKILDVLPFKIFSLVL